MKQVLFGQTDRLNKQGGVYRGINLVANLQHTTVNTAFAAGSPINWELVNITIEKFRSDKTTDVVYNGPVAPVVLASVFYQAQFNQVLNLGTVYQNIYQVQGASARMILKQCAQIVFPEAITVNAGENLKVEVTPALGSVLATVDSSAVSYIYFDGIDAIANPRCNSGFTCNVLRAGESSFPIDGGSGIKAVYFINTDKVGASVANQVLISVALSSDKLSRNDQYDELLQRRYEAFYNSIDADARSQCFELVNVNREKKSPYDVILNNVSGMLSLTGANVTSSKNWLVFSKLFKDDSVLATSERRNQMHRAETAAQYTN